MSPVPPVPPRLDADARSAGVNAAVAARQARAQVKEDLEFSPEALRRALAIASETGDRGAAVARMPVRELLAAMPGVGAVRSLDLLQEAAVSPRRRLGGLGRHQIDRLSDLIAQRATRRDDYAARASDDGPVEDVSTLPQGGPR